MGGGLSGFWNRWPHAARATQDSPTLSGLRAPRVDKFAYNSGKIVASRELRVPGNRAYTSSRAIHSVIERCAGRQPSAAAALPRTRLFEPSEKVAMLRPKVAIASSAGSD
jgi:hypothetical protein